MKCGQKAIALGVALTLLTPILGACGKTDQVSDSNDVITLRILENDTAKEKGYLDELINAFNEAYADKGIQAVDANMDEYSDLAENGPYGYGPDVLYQANDKLMTYAADKHLMAIEPEQFECYETTAKEAWEAFELSVDGKIYTCGIPVNVQEPMLFYRTDMLPDNWEEEWDDNGDKIADFLQNWNDLYKFSKQILEESGGKKYGYMSSLNNLYLNSNFFFSYGAYIFDRGENGEYDSTDIGFGKGETVNGMKALMDFAGIMNEGCIDDTIIANRAEKLATGEYFCTVSTPDTYTSFVEKLALEYENEGVDEAQAMKKANENIQMIELPSIMPTDGDVTKEADNMTETDWTQTIVMGGINGYGISAYTEHREECIEFVNFATSYEMISKRAQMLGIAPTREDVAKESGDVADTIFNSLSKGYIVLMPSIKEVDQIWTPVQTLMGDFAKDAYRGEAEKKYSTETNIQSALENACEEIYDAIYTLGN